VDQRTTPGRGKKVVSPKLVLVVSAVCVLLAAVVVLVIALSGSRSPSEVVKATFLSANQGRYSDANNGLSSQLRAIQDQTGMAKQLWDCVTRKGSITKVEILKEEVRGEGATVCFIIHYKEGRSFDSQEDLVKEGGNWKIASMHYLQAGTERDFPLADLEDGKDGVSKPDPKAAAPKPSGHVRIDAFLGISPDFKVYGVSAAGGVKLVDLETGKQIPSPAWDRDWGHPRSVAFANNVVAVVTGRDVSGESVKVFSRKTGELEQNVRGQVDGAAFTADGRFLAITEFRPGNGYHLILRDIQEKKPIAELRLGSNGYCSLAVTGNRVAAFESKDDQITVVEAETGTVVKKLKSGSFRKRKEFGSGRMPLAISPAGNLLACEAEDAIVLCDIDSAKVVQKLEGHLEVVRAVAFAPDGETVASAAKDKTIRFWNVKQGKEVSAIKDLPAGASELIFSADGKRILVVYRDGEFRGARKAEIRSVPPK
jgi:hypothetical protein